MKVFITTMSGHSGVVGRHFRVSSIDDLNHMFKETENMYASDFDTVIAHCYSLEIALELVKRCAIFSYKVDALPVGQPDHPRLGDTVISSSGEGRIVKLDPENEAVWYRVRDVKVNALVADLTWREELCAWVVL